MKKYFILSLLLTFSFFIFSQTLEFTEVASGFSSPVDIAHAGDDRLFVVERSGRIKIIDVAGAVLATPFLDIDNIVHNASSQSEQGLLGLAFHPNYANNGFFYVNYTENNDSTVIARYSVDVFNPNLADPNSGVILMTIEQTESNHNGGCIRFGPDGFLYIGMGDGGGSNDPLNDSQNTQILLGKMLRIDVDNGTPYGIPSNNPFVNDANVLDEIWAIGLRNPWKFSFDKSTGDMWIADVGQNNWEEIDFQPASSTGGENYGWRCYEGNHINNGVNTANCPSSNDVVNPIYEIQHMGFSGPCSITGGYVYRGTENPSLVGKYICADYCSGEFFMVESDGVGGWVGQQVADPGYDVSTFGESNNGELYFARLGNGRIYKISAAACATLTSSANVTKEPCEGETDGSVDLIGSGGTPPYTFSPSLDWSNLAAGNYNITITDNAGCSSIANFTLNSLPLPTVPTVTVNDNNLTASSGFVGYQWYFNGQAITGATSENYTITESGNYSVEVTGANGCNNTSTETNVTFTSINGIPNLEVVNITPNPFEKNIYLEIKVNKSIDLELEILDLNGKQVFSKKINIKEKYSQEVDLEGLTSGVYYLNLKSKDGIIGKKIVKQ